MSERKRQESVNHLRKDASVHKPGLYRGKVEDIDDPDRLGRVKVRVWAIHGTEHQTPTSALSWAEVAEPGGGGYDYGSFNPPPVGSAVWIGFESGLQDFPVVLGTSRGVPKRDDYNPNIFLTSSNVPKVEKPWLPPDGESETPKDIFDGVYDGDPHPTRRVWQKSYKGHTFLVEDGDGKEFLKIIDRSGQIFEMYCPVAVEYSSSNKAQRGIRDATRGDQLSHSVLRDKRAAIRLRDLSGQELFFDAADQNERVILRSKCRSGTGANTIELKSGPSKEGIEIRDSAGNRIVMNTNSSTPIVIEDSSGSKIVFDKDKGKVTLIGSKISEELAPQKQVTVDGSMSAEVRGDNTQKVHGNKSTTVVNDLALSVLGKANISIGGEAELVVTNIPVNATPIPGKGMKITLASPLLGCDFELFNQRGKIKLNTTLGNVELSCMTLGNATLSTVTGNVECSTATGNASLFVATAGNVTCSTKSGNATLKTSAGIANVDSDTPVASVKLGSIAAAIQPLVKGTNFSGALGAFLIELNTYILGIKAIADIPNAVTPAMTAAITAFSSLLNPSAAGILSAKVFTE